MDINELINKETTFTFEQKDKYAVIQAIGEKARALHKIDNLEEFLKATREREALVSTGIGFGVAIPHVKLPSLNDYFVITALLKQPVDWDSIDGKPVKAVFFIGCPVGRHVDYLKLLAQIIVVVKNNEKRKRLLNAATVEEFLAAFAS
jgi:mannitol/fructose-specific phosphotransferase system IIA component (Ntr-type)